MPTKLHAEILTPGPPNRVRLTACKRAVSAQRIAAFPEGVTCRACKKQMGPAPGPAERRRPVNRAFDATAHRGAVAWEVDDANTA